MVAAKSNLSPRLKNFSPAASLLSGNPIDSAQPKKERPFTDIEGAREEEVRLSSRRPNSRRSRSEIGTMAKPLGPTGEFFRRRDEWRQHPMLKVNLKQALPGFGTAVVAFGICFVGEAAYKRFYRPSDSHSH